MAWVLHGGVVISSTSVPSFALRCYTLLSLSLSLSLSQVNYIVLVVNAHQGGSFKTVETATCSIADLGSGGGVDGHDHDVSLGCGGDDTGCVMLVIYRKNSTRVHHPRSSSSALPLVVKNERLQCF